MYIGRDKPIKVELANIRRDPKYGIIFTVIYRDGKKELSRDVYVYKDQKLGRKLLSMSVVENSATEKQMILKSLEAQLDKLVGEGRLFKDISEYNKWKGKLLNTTEFDWYDNPLSKLVRVEELGENGQVVRDYQVFHYGAEELMRFENGKYVITRQIDRTSVANIERLRAVLSGDEFEKFAASYKTSKAVRQVFIDKDFKTIASWDSLFVQDTEIARKHGNEISIIADLPSLDASALEAMNTALRKGISKENKLFSDEASYSNWWNNFVRATKKKIYILDSEYKEKTGRSWISFRLNNFEVATIDRYGFNAIGKSGDIDVRQTYIYQNRQVGEYIGKAWVDPNTGVITVMDVIKNTIWQEVKDQYDRIKVL